jgi:streptogramin lyase
VRSAASRPRVEILEDRWLLSVAFREYTLPSAPGFQPGAITAGADGNVWFTEAPNLIGVDLIQLPEKAGAIARITPAGAITEYPLPPHVEAGSIAAGPEGDLWFTERSLTSFLGIFGITPGGVISELDLHGLVTGTVDELTAGPDGNLWLVAGPNIDRITPSGVVTTFPVGNALSSSITAGPDGNLWFSEWLPGDSRIGRITPTGMVITFPLPSAAVLAQNLTAGPDGSVWFSEGYVASGAVPKIGRITPAGTITEFPLTTPNAFPYGMTAGPDGNVWFTAAVAESPPLGHTAFGEVGEITPSGSITVYPAPTTDLIASPITLGPDHNLWFSEFGNGKIGEAVVSPSPAPAPPPTVTAVRRVIPHVGPSSLLASFSGPLDPALAQNLANYSLVEFSRPGPLGHRRARAVPLTSAASNASAHTVTLRVLGRLNPRRHYQLTVDGTPVQW